MLRTITVATAAALAVTGLAQPTSFAAYEQVRGSVVLIRGTASSDTVTATGPLGSVEAPVVRGAYVVPVELALGLNDVRVGDDSYSFERVGPVGPSVRVWWTLAADDPSEGPSIDELRKARTGLRLVQAAFGDMMNSALSPDPNSETGYSSAGFGRRTFGFVGGDDLIDVSTLRLSATEADLAQMSQAAVYDEVLSAIGGGMGEQVVHLALGDFGDAGAASGMGARKLALVSRETLDLWPATIAEVPDVMIDETPLDGPGSVALTDGHGLRFAAVGKALSDATREIGSMLGLPSTGDMLCVMNPTPPTLNRLFSYLEPESRVNDSRISFDPSVGPIGWSPRLDPFAGAILNWSPWLRSDVMAASGGGPSIRVDFDRDQLVITAPRGLAVAGVTVPSGQSAFIDEITRVVDGRIVAETIIRLSLSSLRDAVGTGPAKAIVVDRRGNTTSQELTLE